MTDTFLNQQPNAKFDLLAMFRYILLSISYIFQLAAFFLQTQHLDPIFVYNTNNDKMESLMKSEAIYFLFQIS